MLTGRHASALRGVAAQALGSSALPTPLLRTENATEAAGLMRAQRAQSCPMLFEYGKQAQPKDSLRDSHSDSDADTEKELDVSAGMSSLHHVISPGSARGNRSPSPLRDERMESMTAMPGMRPWVTSVHSERANRDAAGLWASMNFASGTGAYRPARVLCVARRYERKGKFVDFVGEYHLDLIQEFGGAPVIVPRTTRTLASLMEYLPMDGLLVVEGNDISDEVLRKYECSVPNRLDGDAATQFASDTEFDISKDELECALMRYALLSGCPILGLCRGSQMLNVLRGGTLIGDIAAELSTEIQHLQPAGETYDSFRHPIHVHSQTPLADMFRESIDPFEGGELMVNSYHHQGVKDLGEGLAEMARAPDGVLEAFYDPTYDPENGNFVVGLQFHPERMLDDYPGCKRVYEDFLKACNAFRQREDEPLEEAL